MIFMKGSIAALKHCFTKEKEVQMLKQLEQQFIDSGLHAVIYAKRKLTMEETDQLIITINEGVQDNKTSIKLENLIYSLASVQLEILGILGL